MKELKMHFINSVHKGYLFIISYFNTIVIIMGISFKTVNSIIGKSLQTQLLKLQQDEKEPDLVLRTDVMWLYRSEVLQRFRDLLKTIFSEERAERGDEYQELQTA